MSSKFRAILSIICGVLLCTVGLIRLLTESFSFIPLIFAVGGLFGFIGWILELKKINSTKEQ
ncbi:hypothetical protein GCM10008967_32880 [Bacillus carboniphilus]|uniref:Uncharacterized protein n=1 Tax=Bacillus carboniphilus TaxID=86663 RepID=A0ABN0WJP3_9BACI